jgi:Acetyltransferase (GNAT) domain
MTEFLARWLRSSDATARKDCVQPQKRLAGSDHSVLRKILGLRDVTSELQSIGTTTEINGKRIVIEGGVLRIAKLEQEWCDDAGDPEILADALRKIADNPADILTFTQRLPDLEPKYGYQMELESMAALPIKSYKLWWEKQIERQARNKIRKAEKKGVVVRSADFDDRLVRGMTSIFNETPIRQGRRFLHYGKDFKTIKRQFSRFLFREEIFGAYLGEELVGFIFLADAGRYLFLGQIISKIACRDLAPNNALLAKAVERCAERGFPYLVYALWLDDSLGDFKRSNGFQRFDLPRYFVPLTKKGKLALKFGFHRGWKEAVPKQISRPLKKLRTRWYDLHRG